MTLDNETHMRTALITNYLTGYRMPLYEKLAARLGVEVLCFGGGAGYVPEWFADLDRQLAEAPFPARRISGDRELLGLGREYDAVIAGFAGGTTLPAAFLGAKLQRRGFVLWASIWAQPRSARHLVALPISRAVYRHADAVVAYGPHAAEFIAPFRRRADDIFIAPQSVEPELFGRTVTAAEIAEFRAEHGLPDGPLVLYSGRLVHEKGVEVLLDAWAAVRTPATLVIAGDGPLAERARNTAGVAFLGPVARERLPLAYAAAEFAVLASIPTPLFREPWGLVCNEAMHQGRPVIATTAVGAVAGGLVRNGETGLVVAPGDSAALADAIGRLLGDGALRARLGAAARIAVGAYTYDAMSDAFAAALERAT
jgi:glycosyltransferase involved in cell wall biosynthesis